MGASHWHRRFRAQDRQLPLLGRALDASDRIIGGQWVSYDRPDFIWTKDKAPAFCGSDLSELGRIYQPIR